ncbi:sigma-70 family RNA polymerase sigma factor [Lentzea sp. NPDC051838]|uniref:RNA polymerase sigma factor n=1 Tax=Lentzea sp. NPDC051838 TaxID=3154849 RepID=UPI003412D884
MQESVAPRPRTTGTRGERVTALFLAVREGRHECLDALVADLTPLLWQVARAQGLDRQSSQDVVQNTWVHFLGNVDKIRDPAAVVPWLVTTTKRGAWRMRRTEPVHEPLDGHDATDTAATPEESAVLTDRQRRLWAAVSRLPRRCQDLLRVVAFVHRPDYAAVAAALGMARGGVGPTRGRCLAQLRAQLEADPDGGWR